MEVSLGFGGARDFCGKRTKPNLEQHCSLIGVRMKKTRPYPLWAELSGQRETQEREISRTAMKRKEHRTETSVPNCKSQGQVVSGKTESSHFCAVVGETSDFTWIQSFIIEYLPSF